MHTSLKQCLKSGTEKVGDRPMQKSALQAEFNFMPKQPCVRMKIAWQLTGPKSLARDRTVTVRCDGNSGVECERFMCENMCIKHARATAYKYIKRNHRCLVRAPSASGGRTDTNTHTDIVPRHSFALRWRCRKRSQSSTMVQFFVRVCVCMLLYRINEFRGKSMQCIKKKKVRFTVERQKPELSERTNAGHFISFGHV